VAKTDSTAQHAHQRRDFALLLGGLWFAYGLVVLFFHDQLTVAPDWLPEPLWNTNWLAAYYLAGGLSAGLLALFSTTCRSREAAAFRILFAIPGLMAVILIPSAFAGHAQGGVAQGFLFIMLSVITYHMAGVRPLILVKDADGELRT
jgi:hypothetical protein